MEFFADELFLGRKWLKLELQTPYQNLLEEEKEVEIEWMPTERGIYTLKVVVDGGNKPESEKDFGIVEEKNENNNELKIRSFRVYSPPDLMVSTLRVEAPFQGKKAEVRVKVRARGGKARAGRGKEIYSLQNFPLPREKTHLLSFKKLNRGEGVYHSASSGGKRELGLRS